MKTRRQYKEYLEVIPLHCYTITLMRFGIRVMTPNRKTHQHQKQLISGQQIKISITIYALMYLCIIIQALLYLLHFFYHYIINWFIHFLHIFCMMNVVRIRQGNIVLRNISGITEAIHWVHCTALELKVTFLKGIEVFHLVLPHFNFWLAIEKCYYVFISTGCQKQFLAIGNPT